jgi:hypothetical protein
MIKSLFRSLAPELSIYMKDNRSGNYSEQNVRQLRNKFLSCYATNTYPFSPRRFLSSTNLGNFGVEQDFFSRSALEIISPPYEPSPATALQGVMERT